MQLLKFLGFDRSVFWEFVDDEQQNFLCSVAVEGVEPPPRGPMPSELTWFAKELRAGRIVVIRSDKDIPAEAAAAAEYNRRTGIRSILVIPLPVDGRVVAAIGFGAFRSTREWPAEFIARVTVIGEVMAQALVRKRSEATLRRVKPGGGRYSRHQPLPSVYLISTCAIRQQMRRIRPFSATPMRSFGSSRR
jgi:GAF domain-containing protein